MTSRRFDSRWLAVVHVLGVIGLGGLTSGCHKDEPQVSSAPKASAAATASARPQVADSDLAEAVAKAAEDMEDPEGAQGSANGPPPNGVLGAVRAQREAVLGAAPKLTLATNGSEPRVSLLTTAAANAQAGQIELAVRTGARSALPTVVLRLEGEQPKAAAKGAAVENADATPKEVRWDVAASELGRSQPGQIPPDTAKLIAKLKGSVLVTPVYGDLPMGSTHFERSKAAPDDLDLVLTTASDALTSAFSALPREPVGQGATWLVSSRETFLGTDVVAYRMFKVEKVGSDGVIVNVDTKRYAAGGSLGLPGLVDNEVLQFSGTDEGQFRLVPGQRLPVEGQLMMRLGAIVSHDENQTPVQIETRALFGFPAVTAASK